MAYRTISVCLGSIQAVPQLIHAARELGARFGAHVRGVFVVPGVDVYSGAEFGGSVQFDNEIQRFYQKHQSEVRDGFNDAMKRDGLAFEFQVVDSDTPDSVGEFLKQSRASDLIVVSPMPNKGFPGVAPDFAERMVFGAGRPVLVLPPRPQNFKIGHDVLIAWNDSRESARACFDALPFLTSADRVRVATVGLQRGQIAGGTIAETLDRHGARTETVGLTLDGLSDGEVLLRAASDYGSSLLVMGCYGHSRFSEFVFGGVSRHVLKNLPLPVLMSH